MSKKNKPHLLALISVVFMTTQLFAQSAEDMKRLKQFQEQVNRPVVYVKQGTEQVNVSADILYNKNSFDGKMDIYEPKGKMKAGKRPVVFIVHGKTPIRTNPKNWGVYKSWGRLLAAQGFVTVIFTHSLAIPGTSINNAGSDFLDAAKFVKQNALKYNIDTSRVAVVGFSAGVPVLSKALGSGVRCLAAFYGFMDTSNTKLYSQEDTETHKAYSLVNYINTNNLPPIFIARAGLDSNIGLNNTIDEFTQRASAQNIMFTVANHAKGVHGFDNQNDDERSREIIEQLITFLSFNLK